VLALLLLDILSLMFNIPLTSVDDNVTTSLNHHVARQVTDRENPSTSKKLYERTLDLIRANKCGDFAKVDNDSMEMIIGINNAKTTSYEQLRQLIAESQGALVDMVSKNGETIAVVADIPFTSAFAFTEMVGKSGLSRYIEPNLRFQAFFVPNDPYWSQQWGPIKIEADYAWNTTRGDPSVLVAIIDTGVDWKHTDLAANYVKLGYDWVNKDADPMDDNGHGTHCAGIIAATLNNKLGIAGLAQVHIMAEKGLDSWGSGDEDDLANAIIDAVDQGADIISCSWGSYIPSALIHEAIKYAYEREVLVIAAAGNGKTDRRSYPAAYDEVVAVSATDQNDNPAGFTNFGDWIELAAPGVNIYSTYYNNSYASRSGTSMSCPHVAAVAALAWSVYPNAVRDWVRLRLDYTADDLGDIGFDNYYGYGRINVRRAVEEIPPNPDLAISSWQSPPYVDPGTEDLVSTTVVNLGAENEAGITVQLLVNGSVVNSTTIDSPAACKSVTVNCSWTPTIEGIYNVTSYVVPMHNEIAVENNAMSRYVFVGIKTIEVPVFCPTIQEAVDAAGSGFTILVRAGTYFENVVIYNKAVSLVGENRDTAIIDASQKASAVIVVASNVNITNLTVRNSGHTWYDSGILVIHCNGVTIRNNTMTHNNFGVYVWNSFNCVFTNNNITGNAHFGFNTDLAFNCTFSENTVAYNFDGITLYFSPNSIICGNNVANNMDGIVLVACPNSTLCGNNVTNTAGVGLVFFSNSSSSRIYHNNFVDNNPQVIVQETNACVWDHGYPSGGNYWSDYSGVDFYSGPNQNEPGSDGIGDTPYMLDADNRDLYPLMDPCARSHEVAVNRITPLKTIVCQGYSLNINVTVANLGCCTEDINITVRANTNSVVQKTIILESSSFKTITFTWNTTGFAKGNYTLSAYATPLPGERDIVDNTYTYGTVRLVTPGDLNVDGVVNSLDLSLISAHWYPGPPIGPLNYDTNYDINSDGAINIVEVGIISAYWTGPPKGPLHP